MIAKKDEISGTVLDDRQIAVQDNLPKWMNRGKPIGVDKDLMHIRIVGFQGIDQFVGRGTVKIPVKTKMNTVRVLELENPKVHGHRHPPFPALGGTITRLPKTLLRNFHDLTLRGEREAVKRQIIIYSPNPATYPCNVIIHIHSSPVTASREKPNSNRNAIFHSISSEDIFSYNFWR